MPNPRTAEGLATAWEQECPHAPKHAVQVYSATAYNACLAEFFRDYARQQIKADRETVKRTIYRVLSQVVLLGDVPLNKVEILLVDGILALPVETP